jgi:CheY-like chemotaxis protein
MVVDHDHDLADSMCAWIGLTTDWTAVPAYGVEQAIAKAREETYDCILLDIAMPSIAGFDAAAMLDKANETGHPVLLAITGDADLRDAASTDVRFAASLLKPADPDRLLGLLAGLVAHN